MISLYLRDRTTVALAEDPQWLVLLHPDIPFKDAVHEIAKVRSLVAFGDVGFEPEVLPRLLKAGVNVVFFSLSGEFLGRLDSDFGEGIALLEAQITLPPEKKYILPSS
jgi:hypothetical protein